MGPTWLTGARILFAPAGAVAPPDAVYCGVEPLGLAQGVNVVAPGRIALVLSKNRSRDGGPVSVANFAAGADLSRWIDLYAADPQAPFKGRTIVVEDASPDTCLALFALAEKCRGRAVPGDWLRYADRWELGDTTATGAPEHSWGALHSALVHPFIATTAKGDLYADAADAMDLALRTGCGFVEALVHADIDPAHIPAVSHDHWIDELLRLARAHLASERDFVDRLLGGDGGDLVDLALEIPYSNRRRILRGAIVVERTLTGTIKAHLRNKGVLALLLHRPLAQGTGNDITLSVDPGAGVWLRREWQAIERAEDAQWLLSKEVRPRDAGRLRMLPSFAAASELGTPADLHPSVEPWYDGLPIYTMVAAPRRLAFGERPMGSKLSWRQVLHVVWRSASPLALLDLRSGEPSRTPVDIFGVAPNDATVRRSLSQPAGDGADGPFFAHLRLGPGADTQIGDWSDTICRALAGFLNTGTCEVDRLPALRDLKAIRGRGGAVIVTHRGVLLFETGSAEDFPAAELRAVATKAGETLALARALERKLHDARSATIAAILSGNVTERNKALVAVFAILKDSLEGKSSRLTTSNDPFVVEVQRTLESSWEATRQFEALIGEANELREMAGTVSDIGTNDMLNAVAVFGFPFALFANFFAFALSGNHSLLVGDGWLGLKWIALLGWLVCGVFVATGLLIFRARRARAWRQLLADGMKRRRPWSISSLDPG